MVYLQPQVFNHNTELSMSDAAKDITYNLPNQSVALLREILPMALWYKEEPKQAALMVRSVEAQELLPEVTEKKDDVLEFTWSDKHKLAAKTCVQFFMKNGNLPSDKYTVAIIRMLGLLKEDDLV
jgi:hypothetical protein